VETYMATRGETPSSLDDLSMSVPITSGKLDAWGREIRYERISDLNYRMTSAGQDGSFGTEDDIVKEF